MSSAPRKEDMFDQFLVSKEQAQRITDKGMFSAHSVLEIRLSDTVLALYERIAELETQLDGDA